MTCLKTAIMMRPIVISLIKRHKLSQAVELTCKAAFLMFGCLMFGRLGAQLSEATQQSANMQGVALASNLAMITST